MILDKHITQLNIGNILLNLNNKKGQTKHKTGSNEEFSLVGFFNRVARKSLDCPQVVVDPASLRLAQAQLTRLVAPGWNPYLCHGEIIERTG